jgi:hypothetical protein
VVVALAVEASIAAFPFARNARRPSADVMK